MSIIAFFSPTLSTGKDSAGSFECVYERGESSAPGLPRSYFLSSFGHVKARVYVCKKTRPKPLLVTTFLALGDHVLSCVRWSCSCHASKARNTPIPRQEHEAKAIRDQGGHSRHPGGENILRVAQLGAIDVGFSHLRHVLLECGGQPTGFNMFRCFYNVSLFIWVTNRR